MKKVILFSFLGFMYSNTQFSIGLDILRQINNELTHSEGESINDIAPYMNDINIPSLTLGIEKIGHLGKKKRIDFGFEYSMNISRKYDKSLTSETRSSLSKFLSPTSLPSRASSRIESLFRRSGGKKQTKKNNKKDKK